MLVPFAEDQKKRHLGSEGSPPPPVIRWRLRSKILTDDDVTHGTKGVFFLWVSDGSQKWWEIFGWKGGEIQGKPGHYMVNIGMSMVGTGCKGIITITPI